jgi:hypothetical protein
VNSGSMLAKQVLCCLNHTSSPFCSGYYIFLNFSLAGMGFEHKALPCKAGVLPLSHTLVLLF